MTAPARPSAAPVVTDTRPFLVFDVETTGFFDVRGPLPQPPRLVRLAWGLYDGDGRELEFHDAIVRPDGFTIPQDVVDEVHGIDTTQAVRDGLPLADVLRPLAATLGAGALESGAPAVQAIVSHNFAGDDALILVPELGLCGLELPDDLDYEDTLVMVRAAYPKRPAGFGLRAAHELVLGWPAGGDHDAVEDARACARLFFALRARGVAT